VSVTMSATRVYREVQSLSITWPSGKMHSLPSVVGSNTRVPWK
jgi:hypothetical protein